MRGALLLCTILGLHLGVIKGQWTPASLPNPQTEPGRCGRSDVPRSWVCDPDGMLSKRSGDVIEGILKDIAAAMPLYPQAAACGGTRLNAGYQVAVAAARSIEVPQGADVGQAAQRFAAELMDRWGVGDPWCNDGVLLLLTLQPRQVAIYAGRGAKRQISAGPIKQIIGRMRPLLQKQMYGEALEGAAVDIGIASAGGSTPGVGGGWKTLGFILLLLLAVGVLATMVISIITCIRRRRSAGRQSRSADRRNRSTGRGSRTCQSLIDKLRQEQAAALSSKQYPSESCPICLEDFHNPGQDSQPSAPPLNPDMDNREVKITVKEEASAGSSSTDLKTKLLGEHKDGSSDRQEVDELYCKPLVLTCGHSFCEGCLSEWMASNDTCPICRAALTQQPLPPAPASCLPQQQQQQAGAGRVGVQQMADHRIEEELRFRLRSVQRMYPQVVTGDVMYNWDQQVRSGEPLSWTAVRAAQLAPLSQQQHAYSGAWGASTGFGGGTSSGGGGASGSWGPPVVTGGVKDGQGQQARKEKPVSWTAVRTAQLAPESDQQHASSGFWGAGFDFGGGSSSGGGGASGGW